MAQPLFSLKHDPTFLPTVVSITLDDEQRITITLSDDPGHGEYSLTLCPDEYRELTLFFVRALGHMKGHFNEQYTLK